MSQIEVTQPPKPAEPEPVEPVEPVETVETDQDEDDPELDNYPGHEDQDRPHTAEKEWLGLVEYTSVFAPAEEQDEEDEEESYDYAKEDAEPEVKHGFVKLFKGEKGGDTAKTSKGKRNGDGKTRPK